MIAKGINTTHYTNGSNSDIQKVLESSFPDAVNNVRQNNYYLKFKGSTAKDIAENVWYFLKNNVTYKADGFHQKIKLPARLVNSEGDCKSLSLFASAIMYCYFPENVFLRYTSYRNSNVPTHVYCVVKIGANEIIIDPVWHYFNSEKPYTFKKDIKMKISTLSGLDPQLRPEFRQEIKKLIEIRKQLMPGDPRIQSLTARIRAMKETVDGIQGKKGKKGKKGGGIKKIALSPARNAYLSLVALNVRGLATRLKKALEKDKAKAKAKWEKLGGKFSKFEAAINSGAKKKPLLGSKKIKGIEEYLNEDITIGVAPAAPAVGTFLLAAAPVISEIGKFMKSIGVSTGDDTALLSDAEAEGGDVSTDISNAEVTDKEGGSGFTLSPMLLIGGVAVIGLGYFLTKK